LDISENEDGDLEQIEEDFFESFNEMSDDQFLIDSKKNDIDPTDPKIIEANIANEQSKDFIISQYPEYEVFDFSIENNFPSYDSKFKQTLSLLKNPNSKLIIFQPCFIAKKIATCQPDVLLKNKNHLSLIQVKATTKTKSSHIMDFFYLNEIIETSIKEFNLNYKLDNFTLCLIAYKFADKNELSFILTDNASFSKSGPSKSNTKNNLNKFSDEYANEMQQIKINSKESISIKSVIHKDSNIFNVEKNRRSNFVSNFINISKNRF